MAHDISGSLDEHLDQFLMGHVQSQGSNSAVYTGAKLLEVEEAKLQALQAALTKGEESGSSTPFDFESFIARKKSVTNEYHCRAN